MVIDRMPQRTLMKQFLGWIFSAMVVFSIGLPSFIVMHFTVQRVHIEQELCVMRDVAPELNTCHGNCYLMKKLRVAEERERHPFSLVHIRTEPATAPSEKEPVHPCTDHMELSYPEPVIALSAGWPSVGEPVPWV